MSARIGTAGWSIPRVAAGACPGDGTHLQRYARVFRGAEINSSFYRPHADTTYRKWAQCAPEGFQFSLKIPKTITHEHRLRRAKAPRASRGTRAGSTRRPKSGTAIDNALELQQFGC